MGLLDGLRVKLDIASSKKAKKRGNKSKAQRKAAAAFERAAKMSIKHERKHGR